MAFVTFGALTINTDKVVRARGATFGKRVILSMDDGREVWVENMWLSQVEAKLNAAVAHGSTT